MKFNPEDGLDMGPHCRNCHKGSSACGTCHNYSNPAGSVYTNDPAQASDPAVLKESMVNPMYTTTGASNQVAQTKTAGFFKKGQNVVADDPNWRMNPDVVNITCSDDGFSWPHRTLGWMMLKDDLFGLDYDGDPIGVNAARNNGADSYVTHDLDSVCLDCHNPTIWNATTTGENGHVDDPANASDNHNDELITRGLP